MSKEVNNEENNKAKLKKIEPFADKNWTELIKPKNIDVTEGDSENTGSVVIEPLERGFGLTLGNALRRVMLSSLQGAAVTTVLLGVAVLCVWAVSGAAGDALRVSVGTVPEVVAGVLCEHALAASSAPEISKRGMVCIGGQFTTLR